MTNQISDTTSVVICDDHTVLAEGLAALLDREPDIEVVGIAGSVAEVLEQAERACPDVVLMDYELPDGDGVTTVHALKEARPEMKVVMLTSFTNETILLGALEAGCSGYLTKHAGAATIADGIRRAASGESLISPAMLAKLLPRLSRTNQSVGSTLTGRELEILGLLADGVPSAQIAERLYLSPNTVRNHVQSILTKLGVHSRLEAVSVAVREGVIRRS